MKLYRAETGRQVGWQSNLTSTIETLEELCQVIESHTGIPTECQILMTSYGNIVRKENVKQVIESQGENEYIVFCYDRDLLTAHSDQVSGLIDREIPTLEPEIPPFDGKSTLKQLQQNMKNKSMSENCDAYVALFVQFDSYSRSLIKAANAHTTLASITIEEQKLQSMALSVALANLKTHIGSGGRSAIQFIERAKKELNRQSSLLKSLQNDIDILKHTSIHHSILEIIEPSNRNNKIKLIDFIDLTYIESIRVDTIDLCKYLNRESTELKKAADDIVIYERHLQEHIATNSNLQSLDANLSDIKTLLSKAQLFQDEMKKGLPRIYETISKLIEKPISALFENLSLGPSISSETSSTTTTNVSPLLPRSTIQQQKISSSAARKKFESFNHLAEYQLDDPLLKLAKCEAKIRQYVDELVESKRDSITEFFNNMRVVSELQDHIALLVEQSTTALGRLDQFKSKYGKQDLESVRQVAFAYGALLIEMVRRKEYINILVKNSNIVANVLAEYRNDEEKRRDHFRRVIIKSLPFKLTGIDRASPQSEVTLNGANNNNAKTTVLNKQDITEFISLLGTVYFQPTSNSSSLSRRPSFLSTSSSSSSSNKERKRNSSFSPKTTSKLTGIAGNRDESLLAFLNVMYEQLTDMRGDFLKSIEINFLNANKIYIDPSRIKEVLDKEDELNNAQRYKPITAPSKEATSPAEKITTSSPAAATAPAPSSLTSSSTFSVVEDDKKIVLTTIAENNELKEKLEAAKGKNEEMKENYQKQEDEIKQLKEALKHLESEKEEFESHIQNLDQLVDNERQTFEQNRKSFLNELKNKDKSADFRIASAEEDFQSKINDLQYDLEEEQRMKKNLEIEHASELNTLHTEHASEIQKLKAQLLEEKQKTQDTLNEKWEMNRRMDQLVEDMDNVKYKLETERNEFEYQLGSLQAEIEDKEKATDEIKLLQQQTRIMVKRAQDDWESKNEEIKRIKSGQEMVDVAVRDLLYRFRMDEHKSRELDLKTDIKVFKENLEAFTQRYDELQYNYSAVTEELAEVSEAYKNMTEVHNEWRTMASHMAEKLEEYRKNVVYELTEKLQLPMDEVELNVLSRDVTPSDDDLAIWNQILHLSSSIPTQKFVIRILDQYERVIQYKKSYKDIKDKYNKLCVTYCEKIAFRNFKVGDVALFLPTRNSTGKPWAAFNINAPHYFLRGTEDTIVAQMQSKEWIVARIVSITEHTTDENDPESNPYCLSHDLKYYQLDVENWRNSKRPHKSKKRMTPSQHQQDSGLASIGGGNRISSAESVSGSSPSNKRPTFSNSSTSFASNIVHSYINK